MNDKLNNITVLITGASSGIGEACAELFARSGARLILLARRMDRLATLKETLELEYSADIITIQCDVRSSIDVSSALETLPEEWLSIDLLINNAGLSRGLEKIQDGIEDYWEEMIDTNIKGLLYITRAVIPGMIERKKGQIVNIASVAGRTMYAGGNVYSATKSAVKTISDSMQLDLNGTGVRVTNIDPGMVETEFSVVRFKGDTSRAKTVYAGMTPLTAIDVAEVVLFCATRPPHVSIHDILLMPTDQASPTMVHRRT